MEWSELRALLPLGLFRLRMEEENCTYLWLVEERTECTRLLWHVVIHRNACPQQVSERFAFDHESRPENFSGWQEGDAVMVANAQLCKRKHGGGCLIV